MADLVTRATHTHLERVCDGSKSPLALLLTFFPTLSIKNLNSSAAWANPG